MSIHIKQPILFHLINIHGYAFNFDFGIKYITLAIKFHEIVIDTKIIKLKIVWKTNSDQLS